MLIVKFKDKKVDKKPTDTPQEDVINVEIKDSQDKSETSKPDEPASKKSLKDWFKNPKNTVIATLAVIVLLLGGWMIISSDDNNLQISDGQDTSEQGVVKLSAAIGLIEGTVESSSDGESWSEVEGGQTITEGEYVRTDGESRVVIIHDDGSAIRLDKNSEVQLTVSDSQALEVALIEGQVYSRVVESDNRTYAVTTEKERFEALGTAYKTATSEEKDDVEVYQSKIKVDSDQAQVEEGNKYDTESKSVSDIDLSKLSQDDFVQWNKTQDQKDDKFKDKLGVLDTKTQDDGQPAPEPAPVDAGASISLSGSAADKGVQLNWGLSNVSSTDGFKVVRSKTSAAPTYNVDTSTYIGDGNARSAVVDVKDGKTYYFRVCIYRAASGTCDTYSNAIQVTAPNVATEQVVAGNVNLSIAGSKISWTISGTAPHGYKVVMSTSSNPTYPSNSIKYVGSDTSSVTLPNKPTGTYYVKVCKYTADSQINGGCTDYSNQVQYIVP